MNISMSNSVPTQQPTEAAEVKRDSSSESVTKASSAASVNDVGTAEQKQSVSVIPEQKEVDGDELKSAVIELNKAVQNLQRNLEFSVDDITGQTVVRVVDKETDEVIRQMPSEEVLKLAQHMQEQQSESGSGFSIMQELKA